MTKPANKPSAQPADLSDPVIDFLVRAGKVISMSSLYGPGHKLTTQALEKCFLQLEPLLQTRSRIRLGLTDEHLAVNGTFIETSNPFLRLLADRLAAYEVKGFTLLQGMSQDEFRDLLDLLSTVPAGGANFAGALAERNISHAHSERFSYRRVTDKEIVINVEEMAQRKKRGSETNAVEDFLKNMRSAGPGAQTEGEQERQAADAFISRLAGGPGKGAGSGVQVEQITAFLKGEPQGAGGDVSEEVRRLASDSEKLADLITEAAVVRQRDSRIAEGESLADFVVACLRRTYDTLKKDPQAASPQGRQDARKKLMLLEKNVLDRLHHMMDRFEAEAVQEVEVQIDRMHHETELRELTNDYVKRRNALRKAEQTILDYMHANEMPSGSMMPGAMIQAGMTPAGWKELTARSGKSSAQGTGSGDASLPDGMNVLAALLSELDSLMSSELPDRKAAGGLMHRIGEEVGHLADSTRSKIETLGTEIQRKPPSQKQSPGGAAIHHCDSLLSEIVQELCQPVSAINCSVSMIHQGYIGSLNNEQRDLLGIAVNCGLQLTELLNLLREIVGVPEHLEPKKMLSGQEA